MQIIGRRIARCLFAFAAALSAAVTPLRAQFNTTPPGSGFTYTLDDVGIGITASPNAKLHLFSSSRTNVLALYAPSYLDYGTPYGVVFKDTRPTEGYCCGMIADFQGNSMIRVSGMQLGYTGMALLQSLQGSPLYLNGFGAAGVPGEVIVGYNGSPHGLRVASAGDSSFAGSLGIGTTTPISVLHAVYGGSTATQVATFDNYGGFSVPIVSRAARGTPPAPSALQLDDVFGGMAGRGYGATAFSSGRANIVFRAAENWTDTSQGSYMTFGTTSIGAVAYTERMRIRADGNVGIGTSNPAHRLTVAAGHVALDNGYQLLGLSTGTTPFYYRLIGNDSQNRIAFGDNTSSIANEIRFHTNGSPTPTMTIAVTGNVGIGTTPTSNRLEVSGNANVSGNVTVTGTLTATSVFNAVYGQDVAEWVRGDRELAPGTVVITNPEKTNEVMPSMTAYDTTVAGVVSAQPGVILGRPGELKATVATSGRVRVRVDARKGPIHVGDLLVTSDEPGTAMKSQPIDVGGRKFHQPGTILGKALEPLEGGVGEILVLLCLG